MAHNQKTGELLDGLPVFATDVVTWSRSALRTIGQSGEDSVVRLALTDTHQPFESVAKLTDAADKLFARFSEMCGAVLIEHEWGLTRLPVAPLTSSRGRLARHPIYPDGFTLVSRVEVIRQGITTMSRKSQKGIVDGHNKALELGLAGGTQLPATSTVEPFRLSDYPLSQQYWMHTDFAYGRSGHRQSYANELYLVDIDPYILSNDPHAKLPYTPNEPHPSQAY